jgi:hypothetical protein
MPDADRKSKHVPHRGLSDWPIIGGLIRHLRLMLILFAIAFGLIAGCAIFVPLTFQNVINVLRNAGYDVYVRVLSVRGEEALKVISFDVDVTAIGSVQRDLGVLGLAFGEGATVEGTVRVSLGADLKRKQFGVLSCDVDTKSIRTTVGRAPLAGAAFDTEKIEQQAYQVFKESAAQQAIEKYWGDAKVGLERQFSIWALGVEVPKTPTLAACPTLEPTQ